MPRTKLPTGSVPVTFRLSREIHQRLLNKAQREQLSVSAWIRKALLHEIKIACPLRSRSSAPGRERGRRE